MKFEECKVGDIVTPKTNKIKTRDLCDVATHTALTNEFIITGLSRYTKTVDITPTNPKADTGYFFVDPSCLNPAHSDKFSMSEALHGKIITPCKRPPNNQLILKLSLRPANFQLITKGKRLRWSIIIITMMNLNSIFCSAVRA